MKVFTVRLPEDLENKLKTKAKLEHRSISEQVKKYIHEAIIAEDNPDLPISFIKDTLEGKYEIESGLGEEYKFGIIE